MSAYATYTDQQLFALIRTGDKEAYTVVYSRFWAIIYRHARKMLRDEQEAEDITQEVFYMLWNKAPELEVKTSVSGYLYTAVRNKIFNRMKHGKVVAQYAASLGNFMQTSELETDHLIREKQLRELIEHELAALPPQMRIIFELSRNEHLSYREIAEQLGVTEGVVRNQLSRALKQLREKLGTAAFLYLFLNNW
jgi:RNA polymerase sigma-70 factor (family 1)